jgi:uncharacterized phage-associated protein
MDFKLDKERGIACLLYVIKQLSSADLYNTLKIVYFADKKHIARYGVPLFGETYVAPQFGPMPSFLKNVVDGNSYEYFGIIERVGKRKTQLVSNTEPDMDELSVSNIECLNESIEENRDLSFSKMKAKSHKDEAWIKTRLIAAEQYLDSLKTEGEGSPILSPELFIEGDIISTVSIPILEIAKASGVEEDKLGYITTQIANDNITLSSCY